jgi:predicted phosphoadenosine phosphosulfate sulfurtransferase
MEFEEFIVLFGEWYGQGKKTGGFIGIRAQESLHRYCAIATWEKRDLMMNNRRWTTKIVDQVYNVYPIYDWRTEDIWRYHAHTGKPHNTIYDKMHKAGVKLCGSSKFATSSRIATQKATLLPKGSRITRQGD